MTLVLILLMIVSSANALLDTSGAASPIVEFQLINTIQQNTIGTLQNNAIIDLCKLADVGINSPTQINFRAVTSTSVKSIFYTWNSKFSPRRDVISPFSLCGDVGGTQYFGCNDLSYGPQCISAIPCTLDSCDGIRIEPVNFCFDIVSCTTIKPLRSPLLAPVKPPTRRPTKTPSKSPVKAPTRSPTRRPTARPIAKPTSTPVKAPTRNPVNKPSLAPIKAPTRRPTKTPSKSPVKAPTRAPTRRPTARPIAKPTSTPVKAPSRNPVNKPSLAPVKAPTRRPTKTPSKSPVKAPTKAPTRRPTARPIARPTSTPVKAPTRKPVNKPSLAPVKAPTRRPTKTLSKSPVMAPTTIPIIAPVKQATTAPASSCSSQPLGFATDYGLFVIGNLDGLQACNNDVAVGGNANLLSDFNDIEGDLIVGGSVTAIAGDIDGKMIIGKSNNALDLEVHKGVQYGNPIDFSKAKTRLQHLSHTFAGYLTTGTTHCSSGIVKFSGERLGLNVFTIHTASLSEATYITINTPKNSTAVINVVGLTGTIQNAAMAVIGISSRNVLWNMPSTTKFELKPSTFRGSILAPNALVEYKYGWVKGSIVASSFVGIETQFEYNFDGCLPVVS